MEDKVFYGLKFILLIGICHNIKFLTKVLQVNPVILQEWDRRLKNITGEI